MKSKGIVIVAVFALVLSLTGSVQGHSVPKPTGIDVLLLLPVPVPDEALHSLTPEDYAWSTAGPLLQRLALMERRGQVSNFELLPDFSAVRVTVAPAAEEAVLTELSGQVTILPDLPDSRACAVSAVDARREVVRFSQVMSLAETLANRPQQANPSISAYYSPSGYGSVTGYTDPDVAVTMLLTNAAGQTKMIQTTTSSGSGRYSFYPKWISCQGYDWGISPYDTVQITAGGNIGRLIVVPISALPDPNSDTVSGTTVPNRALDVWGDSTYATCDGEFLDVSTMSDGAGNFVATMSPGFDRTVSFTVLVYDENGNSCYTSSFHVPSIQLDYGGWVYGYLKASVPVTMNLRRGGSTVATASGPADSWGYYSGTFNQAPQAGDIIEVSGGGLSVAMTAVALDSLVADVVNDRISGNIGSNGAGRVVKVEPSHGSSCSGWQDSCLSTVAGEGGSFTLDYTTIGYDLQRGDSDCAAAVYDGEGNLQYLYGCLVVPVLMAEAGGYYATGNWFVANQALTLTLRDGGGTVLSTDTSTSSSYSASFSTWFDSAMAPGYTVEATDGTVSMILTIPDLTAYLDLSSNTVSGHAPAGSTLDIVLEGSYPAYDYACVQLVADAGNSYSSDLGGSDVQGWDWVDTYYTAPDGHRAWVEGYALSIQVQKESNGVYGYSPQPDSWVIVDLVRSSSIIDTMNLPTYSDGYYGGAFVSSTIQQGDRLDITPEGGSTYGLNVPQLTVGQDLARNVAYGQTVANSPLEVCAVRVGSSSCMSVESDGTGYYEASFDVLYDSSCAPYILGKNCVSARTLYYDAQGQVVRQEGPQPPNVSADAYESDDSWSAARPFQGRQAHTFHAENDVDWTSFVVPAGGVGHPYLFQTNNLGPNGDTVLHLYDTDGTTLIDSDDDSGPGLGSQIVWSPTAAGTYYVEVTPFSSYRTTRCGSTYDLVIDAIERRIPIVYKQYVQYFAHSSELEPNNDWAHANGPLQSGVSYSGYPGDSDDYFYFYSDAGTVTVDLTNYTDQSGQLLFYRYPDDPDPVRAYQVPYHLSVVVPAGKYYVRIYTAQLHPAQPYTFKITYP